MKSVKEIVIDNAALGIKTAFFSKKKGVLGYAEGNTIYLNKYYEGELELVNKHELLHFFENSKQFLGIKKIVLNILKEHDLETIRNIYYLRYFGLYTKEEIDNGVLDNEIIIDFILDNGYFDVRAEDYIKDAFDTIVKGSNGVKLTVEGRKYMNLTTSKNLKVRYSQASKWDQLFVEDFYNGKEKPNGENKYEVIANDAKKAAHSIINEWNPRIFEIDIEDNPYLKRRVDDSIRAAEAKGQYAVANYLREKYSAELASLAVDTRQSLANQYLITMKLLNESDYSDSFKYLIMKEFFTQTYRYEKGNRVIEKRKPNKTIMPFMFLNKFILDEIYSNVDKYSKFGDLYFNALDKYNKVFLKSGKVNFVKSDMGYWIKFNKGYDGDSELVTSAQNLGNLIIDTPWCTRFHPSQELKEGDFYVFVDAYGKPHLAVKMTDDEIDEVRGIKNGADQEIEEEYRTVAIDFLKKNSKIKNSKDWLLKEERNERLSNYLTLIRTNSLSDKDIRALVKDLSENESNVHANVNSNERELVQIICDNKEFRNRLASVSKEYPRVMEIIGEIECNERIKNYIKKIKAFNLDESELEQRFDDIHYKFYTYKYIFNQNKLIDLVNNTNNLLRNEAAKYFDCSPREVYIGPIEREYFDNRDSLPYKIVLGSVDAFAHEDLDLSKLELVYGDLKMSKTSDINLCNLEEVNGNVYVENCEDAVFDSLIVVGGSLNAQNSVVSLPRLRHVYGNVDLRGAKGKRLDRLMVVDDNLFIGNTKTKKLSGLKCVGGRIEADDDLVVELPSLETYGKENINCAKWLSSMFGYSSKEKRYIKKGLKK